MPADKFRPYSVDFTWFYVVYANTIDRYCVRFQWLEFQGSEWQIEFEERQAAIAAFSEIKNLHAPDEPLPRLDKGTIWERDDYSAQCSVCLTPFDILRDLNSDLRDRIRCTFTSSKTRVLMADWGFPIAYADHTKLAPLSAAT